MTSIRRAMDMVRELVPDLSERISQFEVEAFDANDALVATFCDELERLIGELRTGIGVSDNEQIRFAAHSIKGMASAMGLPEISVLSHEIEITLRSDEKERCLALGNALIGWAQQFVTETRG